MSKVWRLHGGPLQGCDVELPDGWVQCVVILYRGRAMVAGHMDEVEEDFRAGLVVDRRPEWEACWYSRVELDIEGVLLYRYSSTEGIDGIAPTE